jgi:hypothetical protein
MPTVPYGDYVSQRLGVGIQVSASQGKKCFYRPKRRLEAKQGPPLTPNVSMCKQGKLLDAQRYWVSTSFKVRLDLYLCTLLECGGKYEKHYNCRLS